MICRHCSHIMGPVDIREQSTTEKLTQTGYQCSVCHAVYVVNVHEISGPTISEDELEKVKNIPNSERIKNASRPKNDI